MRLVILGCLAFYYFSLCSAQTSDLFDEANPTPFNEFDVSNPSELFAESVDLDPSSETLASTDIDDPPGSEIYGSSSADLFDETISSRPSDEILSSTSSTEIFDNESDLDFTPTIYDLGNDGPMNEWTLSGLIASSDLCSAENNQPDSDKLQRREQKKPTTCPPPSTDWKLRPLPRPYRRRLLPIKTDLRVCPVDLFSNRWFVFCDSGNPGDIIWDIWPDEYILYGATPCMFSFLHSYELPRTR